jgi:hypothetical protein
MTRAGYIALALIMAASLIGLIICSVKQQRQSGRTSDSARRNPGEPTVIGEPVRFRCADLCFVWCRASRELRQSDLAFSGLRLDDPDDFAKAVQYYQKDLAYILADQLLDKGGIRFVREGATLRAELRAVMPEVSGT